METEFIAVSDDIEAILVLTGGIDITSKISRNEGVYLDYEEARDLFVT